ncbi:hypothetical protein F7725_020482 [Dissostichus mawsoni]|uniref:Fork-head domain-containing protein n=1 Tax=Dissostichus mawsoni TaxID=36200 RepID=A0A7J5YDB9_DISMA|nr:hypothetical protein F7725_020482 [Dissostichus mawsoni]
MAEAAQQPHLVEIDPDFEPLSRPRSCTWPLPRPEFINPGDSNTSSPVPSVPLLSSPVGSSSSAAAAAAAAAAQRKSSSSRRNAWGNMSYADLITKAIESSPENRLTLSQIYDWMVKSVPYFKDKGDSNSSAGWKNSIRPNLSLHSRFIRVQNEGTGKSSWWMLNPGGGRAASPRGAEPPRWTTTASSPRAEEEQLRKSCPFREDLTEAQTAPAPTPSGPAAPTHSNDDFDAWNSFRPRTSSNASTLSGRLSPFMPEDELGDADVHMGYPGAAGAKMTATLPSLTEMTGSLGHSSETSWRTFWTTLTCSRPTTLRLEAGRRPPDPPSPPPLR